jgi:hypothetical protein
MALADEIRAALAAGQTPRDILIAAFREHIAMLQTAEDAKPHALKQLALGAQAWANWKAHLLDGGGVIDDGQVQQTFLAALLGDDQPTVWRLLPHVVKSWMKHRGLVQVDPKSGSVTISAVAQPSQS